MNKELLKKKRDTITRITLKEELEKRLLLEMALKRKEYMLRIDNLLPQVVENASLVYYCSMVGQETNKNHWKSELNGHIISIIRLNIKENNSSSSRISALKQVLLDYDYLLPQTILLLIRNKFKKENINLTEEQKVLLCEKIADFLNNLIILIAETSIEGIELLTDTL